jgi:hypothetical protein
VTRSAACVANAGRAGICAALAVPAEADAAVARAPGDPAGLDPDGEYAGRGAVAPGAAALGGVAVDSPWPVATAGVAGLTGVLISVFHGVFVVPVGSAPCGDTPAERDDPAAGDGAAAAAEAGAEDGAPAHGEAPAEGGAPPAGEAPAEGGALPDGEPPAWRVTSLPANPVLANPGLANPAPVNSRASAAAASVEAVSPCEPLPGEPVCGEPAPSGEPGPFDPAPGGPFSLSRSLTGPELG